jgi:hypothetical protein
MAKSGLCGAMALITILLASAQAPPGPSIQLSPVIPPTVQFGAQTPAAIEGAFDIFSWNSFIALNWPPGHNGQGDPKKKPGQSGDNPTVWETWIGLENIFLDGGRTPSWDAPPIIPKACEVNYHKGEPVLVMVGKTPTLLTDANQPFKTGPLIDQNKVYARFEIHANRSLFDYILQNKLYSKAGQGAFTGTVSFPCGGGTDAGAIMVKAAWKILGPGDDPNRFHKSQALVYTQASSNPPVQESCTRQTVGLVGFHIGHRLNISSQWVWSTFEQIDNAPDDTDVQAGTLKSKYNFFNPGCKDCAWNQPPPRPWIPNSQNQTPTQVVRVSVLPQQAVDSAKAQNQTAQALLAGVSKKSVWQYYRLISTQWPTQTNNNCTANPANPNGTPFPQFLANVTLETYVQGNTPQSSSSCINCHGNATMTTGAASDFTYLLENAK